MNEPQINWQTSSYKRMFAPPPRIEPPIDEIVSQIVGRKIYQTDPRLIKLIVKWKAGKAEGSMDMDNFFSDPHKIDELKKVLNENL